MIRLIVTWFGAGDMKPAPGTWGSAVAVALGVLIHWIGSFPLLALATVAVTALGFWAVPRYTAGMEDPDRSEIVIDEVAGQWLALMATSAGFWMRGADSTTFPWPAWVVPFLFFRLFDIWKPWLVGRADRRGDAAGVMLDDLWAGVFAGAASVAAAGIYHAVIVAGCHVYAYISWHLVERPARKALRDMADKRAKRHDKISEGNMKHGDMPKQLATGRDPVA